MHLSQMLVFLIALATFGCGARAADSAETFLDTQYAAVGPGDFERWIALNTDDAVFISSSGFNVGHARARASFDRSFGEIFRGGGTVRMTSRGPRRVEIAPGGAAAWISDEAALDVIMPGEEVGGVVLRMNAVLVRRDGRWSIAASHWSIPHVEADVTAAVAGGTWPAPADVPPQIHADAAPLVALFEQRVANTRGVTVIDWTDSPDGAAAMRATDPKIRSGVLASITPDGEVGWVAGDLDVSVPHDDATVRIPIRVLAVWVRDNGAWRLVQWHASIARRQS